MIKKVLLFTTLIIFFGSMAFAGKVELTTYYPSPTGEYDSLQAKKVATGDTNADGVIDSNDLPNRNGDIRLVPQSGDPTSWATTGTPTGQIAYSSANDSLYHFNGASWVSSGGGGSSPRIVHGTVSMGGQQVNLSCPAGYVITQCGVGFGVPSSCNAADMATYAYMGLYHWSCGSQIYSCFKACYGNQTCVATNWGGTVDMLAKCEKPGT